MNDTIIRFGAKLAAASMRYSGVQRNAMEGLVRLLFDNRHTRRQADRRNLRGRRIRAVDLYWRAAG